MASIVHRSRKRILLLLQYSRQRPSFSAKRAALMAEIDLTFSEFTLQFVCFALLFNPQEAIRNKFDRFSQTDHNPLLRIATIFYSFFKDNKLRQFFFFVLAKVGGKAGFGVMMKDYKKLYLQTISLLYKTNGSMLPCVCSVIADDVKMQ